MAKSRRYISSAGLAFAEHREMNKLSRLAAKGWLLESFAPLGYYVRRGEPQELTYCIDYNRVDPGDQEGYAEMLQAGGWTKVCSSERIHVFSAPTGTRPIYSDRESVQEKYSSSVRLLKPFLAVPLLTLLMFALVVTGLMEDSRILNNLFLVAGCLGLVLSVPILMTFTAYMLRLAKVKRGA